MIQAINVFQISGKILTSYNASFITLIPKTENPVSLESGKIPTSCKAPLLLLYLKLKTLLA